MDETISCSTCKALCCRLEVRLIDEADEKIPEKFTEIVENQYYVMKREKDGWCTCLDRETMLCTIYEIRPFLCRDYKEGDYDCVLERDKYFKPQ